MNHFDFHEFLVAKVAFQAGYTGVYYDEFGSKVEIATPSKWITDDIQVAEFASDHNMERIETDHGDVFRLEGKELEDFREQFKEEIKKAGLMTVDELLIEYRETQLKEGMMPINWLYISPKVQAHGLCSVGECRTSAEYMKKTNSHYRIYCKKHATK